MPGIAMKGAELLVEEGSLYVQAASTLGKRGRVGRVRNADVSGTAGQQGTRTPGMWTLKVTVRWRSVMEDW